jgi:aryl-alcohol dehydrogenase-like predicted oxidoreductase
MSTASRANRVSPRPTLLNRLSVERMRITSKLNSPRRRDELDGFPDPLHIDFSGWHLMKSLAVSKEYGLARYVAHQAYYSLVGRDYEWELMPLALDQGVGCVAWSPLGFARLTGKVRRGQGLPEMSRLRHKDTTAGGPVIADDYLFRVVDALDAVAEETGKTVPQVAINWVLRRPSVANVIIVDPIGIP